ncbi:13554_t:CDS:2 [Ambispora gerdemannii]|uniref:site-specific DNA-methyltransferase (adenine-specific) n=1 Tax=Ambispora gerdemannii TaxID=144530 RepID=A0A9N9G561_9GLOM|nr:13554_t:CDS:2 [Ambispora gerdemannii]
MGQEVLKSLGINEPNNHPNFWIYPQRVKHDLQIKEILGKCQQPINKKKPGAPDFTIRHQTKEVVLLIETKTKLKSHQSPSLEKELEPADYNLDGLLYFAEFFKKEFNVLGLAITGERQQEFDLKSIRKEKELSLVEEYFYHFLPKKNKSDLNIKEIRDTAKELNEIIYSGLGFSESEKPFFISACLLALKDEDFQNFFAEKKNVISSCLNAISNKIDEYAKAESEVEKYKSLKVTLTGTIEDNKKLASISKNKENSFVNILTKINQEVFPFLDKGDVIGEFYHEFLKYSTGDGKNLGIVLTPSHIADLFCEISLKLLYSEKKYEKRKFTEKDKILDVCCGTGTFLVNAFKKEVDKDKVFGVEIKSEPYNLALTNMIL